ncbi:MAG: hypothetical protein ACK58L_03035 [Planctomycetota bacterium]
MVEPIYSCPQTRAQVVSMYFLEHRAKLLDIAAYLDRLDRASSDLADPDFRELAMAKAIRILGDGQPHRARRILELLSDDSVEIPQSAHGTKGAAGAVRPVSAKAKP